jgi:SM-20-related protein
MSNNTNLALSSRTDNAQVAASFADNGRVHITDILELASAKQIHSVLEKQQQWNLVFDNNGKHTDMDYLSVMEWNYEQKKTLSETIHHQAEQQFQYHFAAIPIFDIVRDNLLPGHFFNTIYKFLNSPEFIEYARLVTGMAEINYLDMQATRYSKGHFLNNHDDNVAGKNRLAAYVLNLTPNWKPEWGGSLVFPESSAEGSVYFPSFNALNIFKVPQKHFVSAVSAFAPEHRYSLTGWLRS